jgi:hypothetical protein
VRRFLLSCCVILTLTGWVKLYSATGHVGILALPDALFGVSNRILLLTTGSLELGIVFFVLFNRDNVTNCICVGWIALNFLLYRLGVFLIHPGTLCPCLGTLTSKIGLKPEYVSWILGMIAVYMFLFSGFFIFKEWRRQRISKLSPLKM